MLDINDIQEAIVQHLKSDISLVAKLASDKEIKEDQWKGKSFVYPAVRVQLKNQTPVYPDCSVVYQDFSVLCFSELASSMEANDVATLVLSALDHKPFTYNGIILLSIKSTNVVPANAVEERLWVADDQFRALVQTVP